MKTFAYCAFSFMDSAYSASGVTPITCPPVSVSDFDLSRLTGNQFIYFDLHGEHGKPYWEGDDRAVAMTADLLRKANLGGAVVFANNCFLGDDNSPMLDALLFAGAQYVIAGDGENFAGTSQLIGAGTLAKWFRIALSLGWDALRALEFAKRTVKLERLHAELRDERDVMMADTDTLAFKAFYRATGTGTSDKPTV